ncbi:hypothetical protein ACQPW1_43110 [Nocardia sp. CA-128927]|uniref:hypothetical protein n=1 Tax=Nocardia sp. CA-128927 TaxID=3239975 RepID=UPI003D979AA1
MNSHRLPQRIRIDFGNGPAHPVGSYTAPADVIVRLASALKDWNPDYRVTVQTDTAETTPSLPCWRLWIWK